MPLSENQADNIHYDDADLSLVLTRQEVRMTWGKSNTQIDLAIANKRISARTSLTGGTVLVSARDCFRLWGTPKDKSIFRLYHGRVEPWDGFRAMLQSVDTPKNP